MLYKEPSAINAIEENVLSVQSEYNHITYYVDVDEKHATELIGSLRNLDNYYRTQQATLNVEDTHPPTPVWLHVCSPGGYLFPGWAMVDYIKRSKTPVYSIAEGRVASAATLMTMACAKRFSLPHTYFLIHQLTGSLWGKFTDMEDDMVINKKLMDDMITFYVAHSSMKRKQVKDLLSRESWLNAEEALELGIIDEILT
jgi:ATP-dependent Clp protease, protease subunit